MVEYSLEEFLNIAITVLNMSKFNKYSLHDLETMKIRLHPISCNGKVSFELGTLK